jgi:hypothetical protein
VDVVEEEDGVAASDGGLDDVLGLAEADGGA